MTEESIIIIKRLWAEWTHRNCSALSRHAQANEFISRCNGEKKRRDEIAKAALKLNEGKPPRAPTGTKLRSSEDSETFHVPETTQAVLGWVGLRSKTNTQATTVQRENRAAVIWGFFGDNVSHPDAVALKKAWAAESVRRSPLDDSGRPLPPRTIKSKKFSDEVDVVDLAVSQSIPHNELGNLRIPYTLRVHPDKTEKFAGKQVLLGLSKLLLVVDSNHWQPMPDSIFRNKPHEHVESCAVRNGIVVKGPLDGQRFNGRLLADEPDLGMEPSVADGPDDTITFSVRVEREHFWIALPNGAAPSDTQKAVLDAIFAEPFPKDPRGRLIVAQGKSTTKTPKPQL